VGSGLEGFDFSHEGVKRVVGLLIGFVSVIASTPDCFLYLNQRIHDGGEEKKKRKKKETSNLLHPSPRYGLLTTRPSVHPAGAR